MNVILPPLEQAVILELRRWTPSKPYLLDSGVSCVLPKLTKVRVGSPCLAMLHNYWHAERPIDAIFLLFISLPCQGMSTQQCRLRSLPRRYLRIKATV